MESRPMDMPPQSRAASPQIPTDVPEWFMMTPEEEIILDSLMKAGISMNTALDIMASNKVDSMNKLQQLRGETNQPVRPQEFGGLPKMIQPTAPQGQPMPMRTGGAMSQQDMMAYLASKTNTTKNAILFSFVIWNTYFILPTKFT